MAISNSMGNKFGISRFKRFLYDQFFLLRVTALFDVLTILPLLVLGAVKRKLRSLFRS